MPLSSARSLQWAISRPLVPGEGPTELSGHAIEPLEKAGKHLGRVKVLGGRFCLSGGLPNYLLAYGTPVQVADACKELIDTCAADGGFVIDSCFSMESEVNLANVAVMVETAREYGRY